MRKIVLVSIISATIVVWGQNASAQTYCGSIGTPSTTTCYYSYGASGVEVSQFVSDDGNAVVGADSAGGIGISGQSLSGIAVLGQVNTTSVPVSAAAVEGISSGESAYGGYSPLPLKTGFTERIAALRTARASPATRQTATAMASMVRLAIQRTTE